MKSLSQAWPLLALLAIAWLLWWRPRARAAEPPTSPYGVLPPSSGSASRAFGPATADDLAYSAYLLAGDGGPVLDFDQWRVAGRPTSPRR